MEDIPTALLQIGGNGVLFAGLFWMVATGRLVTRREHEAVKTDRDFWRAIGMKGVNTAEKLAETKSIGVAAFQALVRDKQEEGGGGA